MKTIVRFDFMNAKYEVIAVHVVEFPSFSLPINDVLRYGEKIMSEWSIVYTYSPWIIR